MLKFPKIFRSKKQDSELVKKDIVEENTLEQNEQNSEDRLDELSSANEGEVTIQLTKISPADGALLVGFFVSNGLREKIKCHNAPLVLIDSNGRVLARQTFNGEVIGKIVGGSTKACVARFLPTNICVQEVPLEGCQICFDVS